MKNNIELKAFLLSVIITAALKVAYDIHIIPVIIAINVFGAGISYYVLNKSEKTNAQVLTAKEEEHNKKLVAKEEQNNKRQEVIVEDFQKKIEVITKVLNEKSEVDKGDFKEIHNLLKKTMEANLEQKIETDKLFHSVNMQVQDITSILNGVKQQIEKENKAVQDLMKVEKDSLDKLIDSKASLKALEEKIDDAAEHLTEIEDVSEEKREILSSLKNETNRNFEELKESNEKIEESYEEIHKSSISELVKLAAKNEYILNLLMDSYKVLKEIASTT